MSFCAPELYFKHYIYQKCHFFGMKSPKAIALLMDGI